MINTSVKETTVSNYFLEMANDNLKANENLIGYIDKLSKEELSSERGSFFHSIEGIYAHAVLASVNYTKVLAGYMPSKELSTELYEELPYAVAREQQLVRDQQIVKLCSSITDVELEIEVEIYNMKVTVGWVLYRYFIHSIHHRGQISQIFDEMKIEHDWLSFQPENYYNK